MENNSKHVFVKFYADWCNPCKNFSPIFDKVAAEFSEYTYIDVDVDQSTDDSDYPVSKHNIKTIPAVIYFRDGVEVSRKTGSIMEENLRNWIKEVVVD